MVQPQARPFQYVDAAVAVCSRLRYYESRRIEPMIRRAAVARQIPVGDIRSGEPPIVFVFDGSSPKT